MGLKSDIREEARSLGEDFNDIKKSILSKAKAVKKFVKEFNKEKKEKPEKRKSLKNPIKTINKNLKNLKSKIKNLEKKIDSGEASLEDKLDYKKLKGLEKQFYIQAGLTAVQYASLPVAPILFPIGSAASYGALAAGAKLTGSDKSNKRLADRYRKGEKLSPSERYKIKKAKELGNKSDQKRKLKEIINKRFSKK